MGILNDPLWNKGMAFSTSERDRLHLRGLLPPRQKGIEAQVIRIMRLLRAEPDPIRKNLQLQVCCDISLYIFCYIQKDTQNKK